MKMIKVGGEMVAAEGNMFWFIRPILEFEKGW